MAGLGVVGGRVRATGVFCFSSWPRWEVGVALGVALFSWLWLEVVPEVFWAAFRFLVALVGFFLVAALGFVSIAVMDSSREGGLVKLIQRN